jgi:hypothetical protein
MDEIDMIAAAGEAPWPDGLTRPGALPSPRDGAAIAEPRVIGAEWALWGKEAHDTGYHVLRSSNGALREKDFSETITRYSPGELDRLPHYTVSWIPGANRQPEYIALGVHESAPAEPGPADDRSRRDAVGREIVFVRLFCLRYADLAKYALTYQDQAPGYQDLFKAVARIQLPAGATEAARVTLPASLAPILTRGPLYRQAEQVATVLLARRPVCVLGADSVPLDERLRFIDTVMAMLPYGLRATLSAATSASSTSQDLKFRLFFASLPRTGGRLAGGRAPAEDFLVEWGKLDPVNVNDEAARLYQGWLKDVKGHAPAMLADQVTPGRFTAEDIRRIVGNLPRDMSVPATLSELARVLRAAELDHAAVKDSIKRLRRCLAGQDRPADSAGAQQEYRRLVCHYGLLGDDNRLSAQLKGQLYDQLLRVAFGPALTYAGYCEIERSVGGSPLHTSLVSALARFGVSDWLSYILARESQPGFGADKGLDAARQAWPPGPASAPLDDVLKTVAMRELQPRHGRVALDWALRYLDRHSADPGAVLAGRGYLTPVCEYLYRDEPQAEARQLSGILGLAFDGQLGRPEIDQIFALLAGPPTVVLVRAVESMTGRRNQDYVRGKFAESLLDGGGDPARTAELDRVPGWRPWLPWRKMRGGPGAAAMARDPIDYQQPETRMPAAGLRNQVLSRDSPWQFPRTTLFAGLAVGLACFAVAYVLIEFLMHH